MTEFKVSFRKTLTSTVTAIAITALAAVPVAVGVTAMTVDAAQAGPNNGKGGDRGKSGSRGNSGNASRGGKGAERSASVQGGQRGQIASELGSMNASNANQRALENASPNSMPGKLYAYQQTGGLTTDDIVALNEAGADYRDLSDLTPEAVLAAYDADEDGELSEDEAQAYADDLAGAKQTYDDAIAEYGDAYAALAAVRDGTLSLTPQALAELNARLGL